jgi:O-antigen/teichoic acid export membrane protein
MEDPPPRPTDPAGPIGRAELRRRVTEGTALLTARSALILAVGLGANIALARLLTPREFGVVALGMALVLLGTGLTEGGLGASLIRRGEEPAPRELAAVNGVQLALTVVLALLATAVAAPFGDEGLAVAAMVATLPLTILRTPSVIVLERRLRYRTIATVDLTEALVFYAVALIAVGAGLGIWGVVVAVAVRAVAGTATMIRLGPLGVVRPRWSWADVRPLIGFGARMQGVNVAAAVRHQVLNLGIVLIAGVAALGVWSLAWRILQVPYSVFGTVGRIAYPTLSRLRAEGGDVRPFLERGVALLALANGVVLVAIAGFAPALPVLVGSAWNDVPETLLWATVALALNAPVWVLTTSWFFAAGEPGTVLRALALHTLLWFGVAFPLLDTVGVPVIALAWVAAGAGTGVYLARRTSAGTGARVAASLFRPALATLAGIGGGWAVAAAAEPDILRGLLGAAAGEAILVLGVAALRPALLRETRGLLADAVRGPAVRTLPQP